MPDTDDKITIESITSPHRTQRVNRAKYTAMREALMAILPDESPGLTVTEAKDALLPHLSRKSFPVARGQDGGSRRSNSILKQGPLLYERLAGRCGCSETQTAEVKRHGYMNPVFSPRSDRTSYIRATLAGSAVDRFAFPQPAQRKQPCSNCCVYG